MNTDIEIYMTPLPVHHEQKHRDSEREAAKRLVNKVFGDNAYITHDSEGRPAIEGVDFDGMISISHSRDSCVLAVTRNPGISIGIDTETWREQLHRVAPRFLTPEEVAIYNTQARLLLAWTAKEAVYKAARTPGLALRDIHLPLAEPSSTTFTAIADNRVFTVTSCYLSLTRATTTASTPLPCSMPANDSR